MAIQATATIRATCDANTGVTPGDFGFEPVVCDGHVGLRDFVDARGFLRHYCPATGHREQVLGRFGICGTCAKPGIKPPHVASTRCESGGREHCSCDVCF